MELHFLKGDAASPRGHAILIARPHASRTRAFATYCFVPPVQVSFNSLGRYLPPILTQQFGLESLTEMTKSTSAVPYPPILEEIPNADELILLAEARGDDVIEVQDLSDLDNDMRRMELAAMASAEYGQIYLRYAATLASAPQPTRAAPTVFSEPEPQTIDAVSIETMLSDQSTPSDKTALGEAARLIGTLRYALEGRDSETIEETKRALRRATAPLAEKYRADDLIAAAGTPGERGQQLAGLYLARAYRLADEDYAAIPAIEQQIHTLEGQPGA